MVSIIGLVAFGIIILLVMGLGLPGVANGVVAGFHTLVTNPQIGHILGAIQAWLWSVINGAITNH